MKHVDLIFYGELQRGFDPQEAKQRLAALLKLKPEQAEALFSGRRVVLRRGLPVGEAERYVAYLSETVGIQVVAEPQASQTVATADVAQQPGSVLPTAAESPAGEVVCPKCGASQPPRTLCGECAVDMRRFREAQKADAVEKREARLSRAMSIDTAAAQKSRRPLRYVAAGLVVVLALAVGFRGAATGKANRAPVAVGKTAEATYATESIEIYTTRSCSTCAAAKAYMHKNDIVFTEYDIEGDMARRNEFYERGGKGVPLIFVGGKPMHGFDPDQFERLRAEAG